MRKSHNNGFVDLKKRQKKRERWTVIKKDKCRYHFQFHVYNFIECISFFIVFFFFSLFNFVVLNSISWFRNRFYFICFWAQSNYSGIEISIYTFYDLIQKVPHRFCLDIKTCNNHDVNIWSVEWSRSNWAHSLHWKKKKISIIVVHTKE